MFGLAEIEEVQQMEAIFSLSSLLLLTVSAVYAQPLFWLLLLMIWLQQRRSARQQRQMFGVTAHAPWRYTLRALIIGTAGGIAASALLTVIGIDIARLGIGYLWPVALALLLIDLRLLCFAYAGGIIALAHLATGWPDVDVPQLTALVAVLHLVEGGLIRASGADSFLPVLLERPDGVVGGFSLQNFWPLPLALLLAVPTAQPLPFAGQLAMPDWWPLFPPLNGSPDTLTYLLLPVVAALGYGDLALAERPEESSRRAAGQLFVYGTGLLLLSLLALRWSVFCWAAALWAPLGHEWMVRRQMRREMSAAPRYAAPQRGVLVLDVVPDSPAAQAGLQREDVLLAIDERELHSREELFLLLAPEQMQELIVLRAGRVFGCSRRWPATPQQLGLLLVSGPRPAAYLTLAHSSPLRRFWSKLRGRRN